MDLCLLLKDEQARGDGFVLVFLDGGGSRVQSLLREHAVRIWVIEWDLLKSKNGQYGAMIRRLSKVQNPLHLGFQGEWLKIHFSVGGIGQFGRSSKLPNACENGQG